MLIPGICTVYDKNLTDTKGSAINYSVYCVFLLPSLNFSENLPLLNSFKSPVKNILDI